MATIKNFKVKAMILFLKVALMNLAYRKTYHHALIFSDNVHKFSDFDLFQKRVDLLTFLAIAPLLKVRL